MQRDRFYDDAMNLIAFAKGPGRSVYLTVGASIKEGRQKDIPKAPDFVYDYYVHDPTKAYGAFWRCQLYYKNSPYYQRLVEVALVTKAIKSPLTDRPVAVLDANPPEWRGPRVVLQSGQVWLVHFRAKWGDVGQYYNLPYLDFKGKQQGATELHFSPTVWAVGTPYVPRVTAYYPKDIRGMNVLEELYWRATLNLS